MKVRITVGIGLVFGAAMAGGANALGLTPGAAIAAGIIFAAAVVVAVVIASGR